MVLLILKWDIHPDKVDAYLKWTGGAIKRTTGVPGVVEFRAYRAATGSGQVVITYEFADMVAYATWYSHADVQAVFEETRTLTLNYHAELWGPSPVVPAPIRPGQ